MRRMAWLFVTGIAAVCAGCAATGESLEIREGPLAGLAAAEADQRAELVRRDPVGYIKRVAENTASLKQYTLTLTRHERRGILRLVYGPEQIRCWYRQTPFSVKMKWLDETVKYGESTYVAGEQDGKVRFIPRHGLLGLKPGVTKIDPMTSVTWGESLNPVTDFGLERLMQRTLASLKEAGDNVIVRYEGLRQMDGYERTVHFIHIEYPARKIGEPIQELYIDVATDLPAGTVIRHADGSLHAAYIYGSLNTKVQLTDEDFLLDAERTTPAKK